MLKTWGKVFTTLIWAFWHVCIFQNSMLCTINIYNFVNSKINNWSFSQENGNCSDSLTITFDLVLKRSIKRKHSENIPDHWRGSFWLFNTGYDGLWFFCCWFHNVLYKAEKVPSTHLLGVFIASTLLLFIYFTAPKEDLWTEDLLHTPSERRTCCIRQVNGGPAAFAKRSIYSGTSTGAFYLLEHRKWRRWHCPGVLSSSMIKTLQ